MKKALSRPEGWQMFSDTSGKSDSAADDNAADANNLNVNALRDHGVFLLVGSCNEAVNKMPKRATD